MDIKIAEEIVSTICTYFPCSSCPLYKCIGECYTPQDIIDGEIDVGTIANTLIDGFCEGFIVPEDFMPIADILTSCVKQEIK